MGKKEDSVLLDRLVLVPVRTTGYVDSVLEVRLDSSSSESSSANTVVGSANCPIRSSGSPLGSLRVVLGNLAMLMGGFGADMRIVGASSEELELYPSSSGSALIMEMHCSTLSLKWILRLASSPPVDCRKCCFLAERSAEFAECVLIATGLVLLTVASECEGESMRGESIAGNSAMMGLCLASIISEFERFLRIGLLDLLLGTTYEEEWLSRRGLTGGHSADPVLAKPSGSATGAASRVSLEELLVEEGSNLVPTW